jgi:hypothetical protein
VNDLFWQVLKRAKWTSVPLKLQLQVGVCQAPKAVNTFKHYTIFQAHRVTKNLLNPDKSNLNGKISITENQLKKKKDLFILCMSTPPLLSSDTPEEGTRPHYRWL